jgi:hypothetical protein
MAVWIEIVGMHPGLDLFGVHVDLLEINSRLIRRLHDLGLQVQLVPAA